jgi:RNase P/RNase MRP subunit p29
VDEDWINRDEEMDMYANKLEVGVVGQMVKFEKKMDVIMQDVNENQLMRKLMGIRMDLEWNFYLKEVLPLKSMCHFLLAFH